MTSASQLGIAILFAVGVLGTLRTSRAQTPAASPVEGGAMWCYIGTTGGQPPTQGKGIYVCKFDPASGTLTTPELAVETKRPSFVALHPNGKFLYAVHESSGGIGAVAFSIDRATGKLTEINEQPSGGQGPCFVAVDATGKTLLIANYGSGALASLPIAEDGSLQAPVSVIQDQGTGPNPKRQAGPHAHSFNVDPSNHWAIGCDLGTDQVLVFKLDAATATLTPADPPFVMTHPGTGPRHLAFSPDGKFAYVIGELGNTITAFAWDAANGKLSELQAISTLPEGYAKDSFCAEVRVHPNGKFLYASNRGDDSISLFLIDPSTGMLTLKGQTKTGGHFPRNFNLDPTGQWLIAANEYSNDLFVFRIDQTTGELQATGHRVESPAPSCVRFLPIQ